MQLRGTAIVVDTIAAKKPVISVSSATRTLNELESGSVVLFDRAAGATVTLPVARPGIEYDFVVNNEITTGLDKVIVNVTAGTPVIVGSAQMLSGSDVITSFKSNGTTHISVSMNGTTTGGRAGSRFRMTALTSGTWFVTGLLSGTGVMVTPFGTS